MYITILEIILYFFCLLVIFLIQLFYAKILQFKNVHFNVKKSLLLFFYGKMFYLSLDGSKIKVLVDEKVDCIGWEERMFCISVNLYIYVC